MWHLVASAASPRLDLARLTADARRRGGGVNPDWLRPAARGTADSGGSQRPGPLSAKMELCVWQLRLPCSGSFSSSSRLTICCCCAGRKLNTFRVTKLGGGGGGGGFPWSCECWDCTQWEPIRALLTLNTSHVHTSSRSLLYLYTLYLPLSQQHPPKIYFNTTKMSQWHKIPPYCYSGTNDTISFLLCYFNRYINNYILLHVQTLLSTNAPSWRTFSGKQGLNSFALRLSMG